MWAKLNWIPGKTECVLNRNFFFLLKTITNLVKDKWQIRSYYFVITGEENMILNLMFEIITGSWITDEAELLTNLIYYRNELGWKINHFFYIYIYNILHKVLKKNSTIYTYYVEKQYSLKNYFIVSSF